MCISKVIWGVRLEQEGVCLLEGGMNCLKYLKKWWNWKEGKETKILKRGASWIKSLFQLIPRGVGTPLQTMMNCSTPIQKIRPRTVFLYNSFYMSYWNWKIDLNYYLIWPSRWDLWLTLQGCSIHIFDNPFFDQLRKPEKSYSAFQISNVLLEWLSNSIALIVKN